MKRNTNVIPTWMEETSSVMPLRKRGRPRKDRTFENAKINETPPRERLVEWSVPGERKQYMKEKWRKLRMMWLNHLCPTRTCPGCRQVKLESQKWCFVEAFRVGRLPRTATVERFLAASKVGEVAVCVGCRRVYLSSCGSLMSSRRRLTKKII